MKLGKYETNNIYCEDSYEAVKNIPDKSVDLIVIDPPYEVATTGGGGTINSIKKMNVSLQALSEANIAAGYNLIAINTEFVRIMKSINIYIFCNKAQIVNYFDFYVKELGCKFDILCWHKGNALPTYSNKYLSDTEYCLYFHKGIGKCFPKSYEDAKTYYMGNINIADKKLYRHPTIKPLGLVEKLIRNSTNENEIVADFFLGSGTTAVACKNLNRQYIGFEINEEFYNIVKNRLDCVAADGQQTLFLL